MFIVYVLKSRIASKSYVGSTDNLKRRMKEHNSGKHFYTRRHLPWDVVYAEEYRALDEAKQREKYLKSSSGRRFLKKIFNDIEKNKRGKGRPALTRRGRSNGPPR